MTVLRVAGSMEDPADDAPRTTEAVPRSISFSVASLLADTRPRSRQDADEDDDQDSGTEGSVVDVEDYRDDEPLPSSSPGSPHRDEQRSPRGPVRPTPFSALAAAAAAYSSHVGVGGLQGPAAAAAAWARAGPRSTNPSTASSESQVRVSKFIIFLKTLFGSAPRTRSDIGEKQGN